MNWIQEYRESIGMTREQFAKAINRQLGGTGEFRVTVPVKLIFMLEEWPKCYTHPKLINLIARACGATKAQRDQFLHPCRRDYPYRHSAAAVTERSVNPWCTYPAATTDAAKKSAYAYGRRPVVIIDRDGHVVHRSESMMAAGIWANVSKNAVADRCMHKTKLEFIGRVPYTFRYADEWDKLSPSARALEIRNALRMSAAKGGDRTMEPIVVVTRWGDELTRYPNVPVAMHTEHVTKNTIYNRCFRKIDREFTAYHETTYRFASEWDAMTPEQRRMDVAKTIKD